MLDDVVERLLGDPVEDLLDLDSGRRSSRSLSTTIGRPIRPWSAAVWVRSARIRPSCSRLPGRSSKISARISASASRWRSRSWPSCVLAAAGSRSSSSSIERDDEGHREQRLGDRVVELAGEVGALLAGGQLAGLAAQLASRGARAR